MGSPYQGLNPRQYLFSSYIFMKIYVKVNEFIEDRWFKFFMLYGSLIELT